MIETLPLERLDEARALRGELYRHHRALPVPPGYEPRDEDAAWQGWRDKAEGLLTAGTAELFVHRDIDLTGLALVRDVPAAEATRLVLAPTGEHAELVMLVVADGRRGAGAGTALYAAAADWARGRGAVALHVDVRAANPQALRFYERRGARPAFVSLLQPL